MKTVSKSHLKAHMLRLFREIEVSGEELIVTDHRRPVLKIVPLKSGFSVGEVFGGERGRVKYHGDIDAPTMDEWSQV